MDRRQVKIIVRGDPVEKMHMRVQLCGGWGGKKRIYDEAEQQKLIFRMALINGFGDQDKFNGPCSLDVGFYCPILRTHKVLENAPQYYSPKVMDLTRWLLEAMHGIFYKNEVLLSELNQRKLYSTRPRIELILKEL